MNVRYEKATGAAVFESWCLGVKSIVVQLACGHLRCMPRSTIGTLLPCGECLIGDVTGQQQPKPEQLTKAEMERIERNLERKTA